MARHDSGKTNCPYGHPYFGENLIITKKGKRECKKCRKVWQRRVKQKKRYSYNQSSRKSRKETCPIKRSARNKLRDAVRYGKVIKPHKCECCGEHKEAAKLCGHHWNGYINALDVKWLCHRCHAKEHYPDVEL